MVKKITHLVKNDYFLTEIIFSKLSSEKIYFYNLTEITNICATKNILVNLYKSRIKPLFLIVIAYIKRKIHSKNDH
ncbi:TPA: hypothetical protein ACGPMA_005315, partial [Escherichia coli]